MEDKNSGLSAIIAMAGTLATGLGISLPSVISDMRFERRFPEPLPQDIVNNMCQRDFVDYVRNQLWDRYAQEKYHKPFDKLTYHEKLGIDLDVMLDYMRAIEKIRDEDAKTEK